MSPTVESPGYAGASSIVFKHPPIRSNSSESVSDSSSTNSSSDSSRSSIGVNYNNNGSTDVNSIETYHEGIVDAAYERREDVSAGGIRGRTNIPGLLVGLSNLSARNSDGTVKAAVRPAFPAGASVSLPSSTTALDYLLHKHGMSRESGEHTRSDTSKEDGSGRYDSDNRKEMRENMTKTPSASDADSILRRRKSSSTNAFAQQFFKVEPCLYTHRMFQRAAKIFQVLKTDDEESQEMRAIRRRQGVEVVDNDKIPELDFLDAHEQVKTFELTFATLKFQTLFREILDQTAFFLESPNLIEDYCLVCIILYDLQSRKFQRRTPYPDEELDEVCLEIEKSLLEKKTRFQSQIAKERIKKNAPSLEYLLPEQVRNKDETKTKTLVYLWINQIKIEIEDLILDLKAEGFTQLEEGSDISVETDNVFMVDPHCPDLLVFPPHLDMYFKDTKWVKMGQLVQQDKSSCLAPHSVQYLLGLDQDVIHVNVGTCMTTAHLGSLLKKKQSPQSHIWGFGVDGPEKAKKAMKNLEFLGVKNTKILTDDFLSVDPEESRFKSVRVIMITANCSKSAITSPVQFIVSEGEDMRFLRDLSKPETDVGTVTNLMFEHEKILKHALKFPRVRAIVYSTRSRHEAENESVVTRVLEFINATSNTRKVPFKVTPPVLPFTGDEIDGGEGGVDGRFIRFLPSDKSNGCFVAVISREPDDPKDVARSAIARAKSKGLLGKAKSTPTSFDTEESDTKDSNTLVNGHQPRHGRGGRKLKGTVSAPEVKSGLRSRLSGHKSPAAVGARLYQAGLLSKMEQARNKPQPEHLRVVKHPAPFSETNINN